MITIFGLSLNIFLLVVFIKSATLHTLENSFVVNLIITDIVLGIHALGYTTFQNIGLSFENKYYDTIGCLGMHSVNMCISSAQFSAFCMLTFDQFLKVVYPFTHNRLCTKRNIILVIITIHAVAVIIGVTSGLNFHRDGEHYCLVYNLSTADSMIVSFIFLFCVIMATFGLNLKILMAVRHQRREIIAQARPAVSEETKATNITNIGSLGNSHSGHICNIHYFLGLHCSVNIRCTH